jgi:hypothetical protein
MAWKRFTAASAGDISKNILTKRLGHLVDHAVLERVDVGRHGTRNEYVLTSRGKDLFTLLTALRQWGDRWIFGEGNEPVMVLDRRTGKPIPRLRVLDKEGEPLRARDIVVAAGPGASASTRARADGSAATAASVDVRPADG